MHFEKWPVRLDTLTVLEPPMCTLCPLRGRRLEERVFPKPKNSNHHKNSEITIQQNSVAHDTRKNVSFWCQSEPICDVASCLVRLAHRCVNVYALGGDGTGLGGAGGADLRRNNRCLHFITAVYTWMFCRNLNIFMVNVYLLFVSVLQENLLKCC